MNAQLREAQRESDRLEAAKLLQNPNFWAMHEVYSISDSTEVSEEASLPKSQRDGNGTNRMAFSSRPTISTVHWRRPRPTLQNLAMFSLLFAAASTSCRDPI